MRVVGTKQVCLEIFDKDPVIINLETIDFGCPPPEPHERWNVFAMVCQPRWTDEDFKPDPNSKLYYHRDLERPRQWLDFFFAEAPRYKPQLILLPELSVPEGLVEHVRQLSKEFPDCVIVAGSHYHTEKDPATDKSVTISRCPVIYGGELCHVEKVLPAEDERHKEETLKPKVGLWGGHNLKIFRNTPVGSLGVLICSDHLDYNIRNVVLDPDHDLHVLCIPSFQNDSDAHFLRMEAALSNVNRTRYGLYFLYANNWFHSEIYKKTFGDGRSAIFAETFNKSPGCWKNKVYEINEQDDYVVWSMDLRERRPASRGSDPTRASNVGWIGARSREPRPSRPGEAGDAVVAAATQNGSDKAFGERLIKFGGNIADVRPAVATRYFYKFTLGQILEAAFDLFDADFANILYKRRFLGRDYAVEFARHAADPDRLLTPRGIEVRLPRDKEPHDRLGLVAAAFRTGEAQTIDDVRSTEKPYVAYYQGTRSELAVPIFELRDDERQSPNNVSCVLNLESCRPNHFSGQVPLAKLLASSTQLAEKHALLKLANMEQTVYAESRRGRLLYDIVEAARDEDKACCVRHLRSLQELLRDCCHSNSLHVTLHVLDVASGKVARSYWANARKVAAKNVSVRTTALETALSTPGQQVFISSAALVVNHNMSGLLASRDSACVGVVGLPMFREEYADLMPCRYFLQLEARGGPLSDSRSQPAPAQPHGALGWYQESRALLAYYLVTRVLLCGDGPDGEVRKADDGDGEVEQERRSQVHRAADKESNESNWPLRIPSSDSRREGDYNRNYLGARSSEAKGAMEMELRRGIAAAHTVAVRDYLQGLGLDELARNPKTAVLERVLPNVAFREGLPLRRGRSDNGSAAVHQESDSLIKPYRLPDPRQHVPRKTDPRLASWLTYCMTDYPDVHRTIAVVVIGDDSNSLTLAKNLAAQNAKRHPDSAPDRSFPELAVGVCVMDEHSPIADTEDTLLHRSCDNWSDWEEATNKILTELSDDQPAAKYIICDVDRTLIWPKGHKDSARAIQDARIDAYREMLRRFFDAEVSYQQAMRYYKRSGDFTPYRTHPRATGEMGDYFDDEDARAIAVILLHFGLQGSWSGGASESLLDHLNTALRRASDDTVKAFLNRVIDRVKANVPTLLEEFRECEHLAYLKLQSGQLRGWKNNNGYFINGAVLRCLRDAAAKNWIPIGYSDRPGTSVGLRVDAQHRTAWPIVPKALISLPGVIVDPR